MTLGNMRELGVNNLLASCLTDICRYTALIDVSNYPADTEARRNAVVFGHPSRGGPGIKAGPLLRMRAVHACCFSGHPTNPDAFAVVT